MEKGLGLTLDDLPIQNIILASPAKQFNMEETVVLPSQCLCFGSSSRIMTQSIRAGKLDPGLRPTV